MSDPMGTPTDRAAALERLSHFMGWEVVTDRERVGAAMLEGETVAFRFTGGSHEGQWGTTPTGNPWNPFTDANAERQVQARAWEIWGDGMNWTRYTIAYMRRLEVKATARGCPEGSSWGHANAAITTVLADGETGDIASAVLAVLDSTPTPTEPGKEMQG